eukprot:6516676-Alexandrium_andersonii.AAC.1
MDDADIADVAGFGALAGEEPRGPAWSECSDGHGAGSGARQFRDDVTGATLPPELAAAARPGEIRFVESWGVWDVRPISECLSHAGGGPIGG